MKNETIQEYVSAGAGCRVDRAANVIRGCRVLGLESKNGRTYPPTTLRAAVHLYESAAVNVNHPKGNPGGPRDYQDRIGRLQGITVDAGGLRGDFHFNPKHALAEQLIWDAEHSPENVGFSHNVEARTSRRDGKVVVEEITRVQSVDLVADPATTRGLFEQHEPAGESSPMSGCKLLNDALGIPDLVAVADFAETITDGASSVGDRTEFCEAIGIEPSSTGDDSGDGGAKAFLDEITD